MQGKKGFTLVEYMVCIPMIIIVAISLTILFHSIVTANNDLNGSMEFESNQTLLSTSIMTDLAKGLNSISFINGDKTRGFILNGATYDFSSTNPINYKALNITIDIAGNKLIVNTKYRGSTFQKEYNIKYWSGEENG